MGGCQSSEAGYAGAFDLSGNVLEWEDSCDGNAGNSDICRLRGGGFYGDVVYLRCDGGAVGGQRDDYGGSIGFRCCSSP